jgi:hypothetical protein
MASSAVDLTAALLTASVVVMIVLIELTYINISMMGDGYG